MPFGDGDLLALALLVGLGLAGAHAHAARLVGELVQLQRHELGAPERPGHADGEQRPVAHAAQVVPRGGAQQVAQHVGAGGLLAGWRPAMAAPDVGQHLHGHYQFVGPRSRRRVIGTACPWSRRSGDAGDLGPNPEGSGEVGSILGGWNLVSAKLEEVVDHIEGGQEPLRLARRLEALYLSFSLSRRLARVLRPVVQPLCLLCSTEGITSRLAAP